ncbi:helix-turn-helix transcriptional regulator [Siphonobacter curvatus]|uniref:HTH araC/xylS-type domain-containing protein n=1 Tax=Siphonobacter curvatus TaxID=2094562 RepID=A0A2S7IT34_9BACT|nr:AraC family transcriptional regulator [Siphonobacter curvatus]PQA60750.1 hypothetical protein C5O19_14385 [Siphonobacter curvatus]
MEVDVRIQGTEQWLCHQTFAAADSGQLSEKHVNVHSPTLGTIQEKQTLAGSYFICDIDFQVATPTVLDKQVHGEALQMHFLLEANSTLTIKGLGESRVFSAYEHTLGYLPESESLYRLTPGAVPLEYFTVVIPSETYFRLLPPESPLHPDFFGQCPHYYMAPRNGTVSPEMARIIRSMQSCQRTGDLKRLFLEARILELLMLQIEQLHTQPLDWQRADERKLLEAREILQARYQHPPTIQELSRLVGLNEFKLKKGFKTSFDTTIYHYVSELRMQQARQWLLDREKTIGEIAHSVGYKNHAHFTAAYKRHFGELPSQYSREKE